MIKSLTIAILSCTLAACHTQAQKQNTTDTVTAVAPTESAQNTNSPGGKYTYRYYQGTINGVKTCLGLQFSGNNETALSANLISAAIMKVYGEDASMGKAATTVTDGHCTLTEEDQSMGFQFNDNLAALKITCMQNGKSAETTFTKLPAGAKEAGSLKNILSDN